MIKDLLPIETFKQVLPLGKAIWMYIDVALDIRQALKYHEYAYDANGAYKLWAENNIDPLTNLTETVSKVYFMTSITIFFLPPFLLALYYYISSFLIFLGVVVDERDEFFCSWTKLFMAKCHLTFDSQRGRIWFMILCHPMILIIDYVVWFVFCYLFLPLSALVIGVYYFCGVEVDPDKDVFDFIPIPTRKKDLPWMLVFEQFGEALPQLILSVVFLANNYPFLLAFDTLFEIPFPITLVSAISSFGFVCMGSYSGCKACGKYVFVCEKGDNADSK